MALNTEPQRHWPSIGELLEGVVKHGPEESADSQLGMTHDGRVVTGMEFATTVDQARGFRTFAESADNLKQCLKNRITARSVAQLEGAAPITISTFHKDVVPALHASQAASRSSTPEMSDDDAADLQIATANVDELLKDFDIDNALQVRQLRGNLERMRALGESAQVADRLAYLCQQKNIPQTREDIGQAIASKAALRNFCHNKLKAEKTTAGLIKPMNLPAGTLKSAADHMMDANPVRNPNQGHTLSRYYKVPTSEQVDQQEYLVVTDFNQVRAEIAAENTIAAQAVTEQTPDQRFDIYTGAQETSALEHLASHPLSIPGTASADTMGRRLEMQDASMAAGFSFRAGQKTIPVVMSAVFDGHGAGGGEISKNVARDMPRYLAGKLEKYNAKGLTEAGIWNALKLAPVDLSRDPNLTRNKERRGGTTFNLACVIEDRLWVVNGGDSRALAVFPNGSVLQMSDDMRAVDIADGDDSVQQNRHGLAALQRGGRLTKGRVYCGSVNCQVTGSIGDNHFYGVITPRPNITSYPLEQLRGATVVQCCDGVFDVASSAQVAELVHRQQQSGARAEDIAGSIVAASYLADSDDNITALVAPLPAMVGALGTQPS